MSSSHPDILLVDRATQARDDHATNDRLLLDEIGRQVSAADYSITRIGEGELEAYLADNEPQRIVSMAQDPQNTALLAPLEAAGARIVNSFTAVLQTYRSFLAVAMAKRPDLPFVPSSVFTSIRTDDLGGDEGRVFENLVNRFGPELWIKRGDVHAAHAEDVQRVDTVDRFLAALASFRRRSVETVVVQPHVPGHVVKFYAVADDRFFHLQDFETGATLETPMLELRSAAFESARFLGLTIFGGDAVISSRGFTIIDINAFPSFGTVRMKAVPSIVDAILESFARTDNLDDER